MLKNIGKLILFSLIFMTSLAGALHAQPKMVQGECLVMPGHEVRPQFYVDYKGERIYMCCRNCEKAFKRHPEKFLAKRKEQ